jgi:hypothetical protein
MVIKLDYQKAKKYIVNREEFMMINSMSEKTYKMWTGIPILVNVEGSYIDMADLAKCVVRGKDAYTIERYASLVRATALSHGITFVWKRDKDGRIA